MDYGLYWPHGPPWVVLLGVMDALSDQTVMLSNNVLEHHPQALAQVEGRATRYYDLRICAFVGLIQAQMNSYSYACTPTNPMLQIVSMFFPFPFLLSSFLSVKTVSSIALRSSLNPIPSSPNQPAVLETLNASNASLQGLTNPVSSYSPDCSILYGRNLNLASCQNALAKISRITTPMTFGQRGTGDWDVILPRRYLSGTSSPHRKQCSLLERFHMNSVRC